MSCLCFITQPNICTDPLIETVYSKCIISVSLLSALHLCVYTGKGEERRIEKTQTYTTEVDL